VPRDCHHTGVIPSRRGKYRRRGVSSVERWPRPGTPPAVAALARSRDEDLRYAARRDENGFGIFRNSGNRFRNFSIGFIGNGIFRKRNRFSEFSIGIGIEIGVVFYRPFPSVTGFCRKLPDLCLGNFRNCVSEIFRNFFRNFSACDFFASPIHL
jgi:hypothetical protein